MNATIFRLAATSTIAAACLSACGGGGGGGTGTATAAQTVTSPSTTTPVVTTPVTTPVTAPVTTPVTTPVTDPVTTPATDPVTVPVTTPVTTPVTDPVTTPVTTPGVQFGTATLSMAGGYACGLDAVNVTVTKLRFHMSATAVAGDAGWTEIALQTPRRINVAQLNNGAVSALGTAALLPGHYAQARVVLDQNAANGTVNSVIAAGTEQALLTQTAATDGVVIAMPNGFDVVNGKAVNLVANFDACHSVMPSASGYLLRPAIDMVPTEKNGIDGFVDKAILGSNVRISAQQNGVVIRSTAPDATTGEFLLARLAPGSYDLVVTADGRSAAVVAGVKIGDAVSVVAVNNSSAPISLVTAAAGVIDAKLALEPVSAVQAPFGSALQAFVNGPQVSMRERMAVLGSGLVHFDKLSLGLPSLAIWQAGQPLSWTTQAAVTQGAAVYTVSSSAPNYVTLSTLAMTAK